MVENERGCMGREVQERARKGKEEDSEDLYGTLDEKRRKGKY